MNFFDFKKTNNDKLIVVIYGNCHTTNIRIALENYQPFCEKYVFFPIKAIQEVKDNPDYFEQDCIKQCDVFIHQSIRIGNRYGDAFASENIIKKLKPGCRIISIPNVYHLPMCYFPQYYPAQELRKVKSGGGTVFFRDKIIDECLEQGYGVRRIISEYKNTNRFAKEELSDLWNTFIEKVKMREKDWDIRVSDFLINNKNKVLFFDPNHPTPIFMEYVCKNLLELLDIDAQGFDKSLLKNMDSYEMPYCASVIDFFKLNYDIENKNIRLTGVKMAYGEMNLKAYINQYMSLLWQDESIKKNIASKSRRVFFRQEIYNFICKIVVKIRGGK